MKLVIWNCSQGLHRKALKLLELTPDIAIVPKAARQARTLVSKATGSVWVGEEKNKGLGVYAFNGYKLELHPSYDKQLQWVAPIIVTGPTRYLLFAVWAMNHWATDFHPDQRKRGQVETALEVYDPLIKSSGLPLVVAGDFNSCLTWDKREKHSRHANAHRALEARGLRSVYHTVRGEAQGHEIEPTIYWRDRSKTGPQYQIDFCYVPESWFTPSPSVVVGAFSPWVEENWSDHVPLIVDIPGN